VVATAVRLVNLLAATNPWILLITATAVLVALIISNWDAIVAALSAAFEWVKGAAAAAWQWITDVVGTAVDMLVESVRRGVRWVLDAVAWFGELPGKVGAWFRSVYDAAVSRLGELVSWVRGLPGRILDSLGNLGSLLVSAGEDLIRGIVRGLGNAASWIWNKLKELVSDAWNGVLDFFGIASPAKEGVFVGEMIGLGIAGGLDAMVALVVAAAARLAEAAMPALAEPVIPAPRSPTAPGLASLDEDDSTAAGSGRAGGAWTPVHIEHFHAHGGQSPQEIGDEIEWAARGGGH
jgi:phage-related protein